MGRAGHTLTFVLPTQGSEYFMLDMATDSLPSSINDNTNCVFIYVDNMQSDLDLTGYSPTGLKAGDQVKVYKADNSPYSIIFNDPILGETLNFVDKKIENYCFTYNGTNLHI